MAQSGPCEHRDALRASLKGLHITSVKWRCKARVPRFAPGDPVWALTAADRNEVDDETGQPYLDHFPGVIVGLHGSKALLHIAAGASGRSGDSKFVPGNNNGFCMIPLSRLEPREAAKQRVCFYCSMPEFLEHPEGYTCAPPANARKWIGGEPAGDTTEEGDGSAISDRRTEA